MVVSMLLKVKKNDIQQLCYPQQYTPDEGSGNGDKDEILLDTGVTFQHEVSGYGAAKADDDWDNGNANTRELDDGVITDDEPGEGAMEYERMRSYNTVVVPDWTAYNCPWFGQVSGSVRTNM